MKINIENPTKMVLQDQKYSRFLTAGGLLVCGLLIACLFGRQKVAPIIVGIACMAAGAFIIYITRRITIQLDNATGNISILSQSIKRKDQRQIAITQVTKLVLRKLIQTSYVSNSSSSRGRSAKTYYQFIIVFVIDQREELPFDFGRVSAGITNLITSPDDRKKEEAQRIASFINVPLEIDLPSAGSVLAAIKEGVAGRWQRSY